MKHSLLFALLLILSVFAYSQSDYRSGFIITSGRDTLSGLINYKEGDNSYDFCEFKESKKQLVTTYKPSQIYGYGFINDKYFESRNIKRRDSTYTLVFLQVLVRGNVSLYKYKDSFWVEKEDKGFYQLYNEVKETLVHGDRVMKYDNEHIAVLNYMMGDCMQMKESINRITLYEKPLTNLVEDYNKCKGSMSIVFKTRKPWIKFVPGVAIGADISQLSFKDKSGNHDYLSGSFELSKSPTAGFTLDILSPRLSERFSFSGGLLFEKDKYYHYTYSSDGYVSERNYVTIGLDEIKVPVGLKYTFPERKITPYLIAAVSNTFHLNHETSWLREIQSGNIVETNKDKSLEIKDNQLGFMGGVGILKSINKHFNTYLEFRVERTDGIIPFSTEAMALKSKILNFQLFTGIRIK